MLNDKRGAAVKFPPPLVYLLLMIAGYGLQRLRPITMGTSSSLNYIGLAVALSGLGAIIFIRQVFRGNQTSIEPWEPTTQIITTGFYAYSRNPIYIALCLVPIGVGFFFNSFWILISFVPSLIVVYLTAIRKEEAYLETKFGDEYLQYKSRVRRWL